MRCEPQSVRRRAPGVIKADESYSLKEFLRRADLGDHTWRQIRKRIKLRRIGYKIFILGSDWLEFLNSVEPDPIQSNPPRRPRRKSETPAGTHGCQSAGGSFEQRECA